MRISFRLLFAVAIFYYSMTLLNWSWSLHADPWRAEDFAAEQLASKGLDWPQESFRENAGKIYVATYRAPDDSGRYATVEVKKTDAGWQLVSFKEGTAAWRKRVTASR